MSSVQMAPGENMRPVETRAVLPLDLGDMVMRQARQPWRRLPPSNDVNPAVSHDCASISLSPIRTNTEPWMSIDCMGHANRF
jgi:hypothetical protein